MCHEYCTEVGIHQGRQKRGGWDGLSRPTFARAVTFIIARACINDNIDIPIICSVSNTVTITDVELGLNYHVSAEQLLNLVE